MPFLSKSLSAMPSQADAKRFKRPSVLGTFSSSTPPSATMTTSPSLWSLPIDASHLSNSLDSEAVLATKPGASNGSPLSRFLKTFSPLKRKKMLVKTLVISGIGPLQMEGIRDWCMGFGEVSQIRHMPNGDLHVDFEKKEVADMVCRIWATVFIKDVGRVSLSWFSSRK